MIVQLKDNQPALCEKVESTAAAAEPLDADVTTSQGHHRHETRAVAVFDARDAVAGTEWQDHIAAIIKVSRTVHKRNSKTGLWDTTANIAFYLSSRPAPASLCASAIRGHWGVENRNHYPRDVAFDEDGSRIRVRPGVFARLRSFAYNILRVNKTDSFTQARYAAALGGIEGLLAFGVG